MSVMVRASIVLKRTVVEIKYLLIHDKYQCNKGYKLSSKGHRPG